MANAATAEKATETTRHVRPIRLDRVLNLAHATGEPRQIVLEDGVDPAEVLADVNYWQDLGASHFPAGAKFEMTNDSGSFLFGCWIRNIVGNPASGIRAIKIHHRAVWDEPTVAAPAAPTGKWEVRYDGRHLRWRAYRPNGAVVERPFNSEAEARSYVHTEEGNPRAK